MELRSLEAFVWVFRLGQFRAAAKKLNVTQPAISTRIAQLESELGVRLFERGSQQVALTEKGRELLDYAEQMLSLREQMRFSADQRVAVRGQIRVGVSETLVHTWFPEFVQRLGERYPLLTLEMQVDIKGGMMKALFARQLDIAFVTEPVTESGLSKVKLCSYPLAWMASPSLDLPGAGLELSALTRWPIITYARNSSVHVFIERLLEEEQVQDARIYTSWSMSTTLTMVMNGFGVGTLPVEATRQDLSDGRLRILQVPGADLPMFDFVAVYLQGPDSFIAKAVARVAKETAHRRNHGVAGQRTR